MADLIPCIDCGHRISRSADKCPKCQSSEPFGVPCKFCEDTGGARIPVKEAYLSGHRTYFHPECIKKVLSIPGGTLCPDCGVSQSQAWSLKELSERRVLSCKNCGMWDVLCLSGMCSRCQLPILIFHKMKSSGSARYHDFCFELLRQQEQKSAEQKQPEDKTSKVVKAFTVVGGLVVPLFLIIGALINGQSVIEQLGRDIGLVLGGSIVGMAIGWVVGFIIDDMKRMKGM